MLVDLGCMFSVGHIARLGVNCEVDGNVRESAIVLCFLDYELLSSSYLYMS